MKLVVRYMDKETRTNIRIEEINVPFNTKKISLKEMDACETMAYKNCKDDEVVMGWKLEEEK